MTLKNELGQIDQAEITVALLSCFGRPKHDRMEFEQQLEQYPGLTVMSTVFKRTLIDRGLDQEKAQEMTLGLTMGITALIACAEIREVSDSVQYVSRT